MHCAKLSCALSVPFVRLASYCAGNLQFSQLTRVKLWLHSTQRLVELRWITCLHTLNGRVFAEFSCMVRCGVILTVWGVIDISYSICISSEQPETEIGIGIVAFYTTYLFCICNEYDGATVITSNKFVLLVVGVVWRVNGIPPTSNLRGANTIWGIELKIGRVN